MKTRVIARNEFPTGGANLPVCPEARQRFPTGRPLQGFSLIEALVYMGILFLLMGIGYAALNRCEDNSVALRKNVEDIASALHAGEQWRADIRAARGPISLLGTEGEQTVRWRSAHGEIVYRFSTNTVFRRVGSGPSIRMLRDVKVSALQADRRSAVTAWRWEFELQTRSTKPNRMRPLFTFIAVPGGDATP
jgi:Tfp pilus assembly protein FimT